MFCKYCGKEIKDGSLFCTFCGRNLAGAANQPWETETQKELKMKKKFSLKWILPVVIAAAVVFGVGGVAVSHYLNQSESDGKQAEKKKK